MRKTFPNFAVAFALLASLHVAEAKSPGNVRYTFAGPNGATPMARLVADKAGNLYGTTKNGGDTTNCRLGCGTVFKIARNGGESVLHTFEGSDGQYPIGGLAYDAAGNLYGTTSQGGSSMCSAPGCGVLFKIATDGTYSVIRNFGAFFEDGENPMSAVMVGHNGYVYGTTSAGGLSNGGGVFEYRPGQTTDIIYSFDVGSGPIVSDLIADTDGKLYGTTPCSGTDGHGSCQNGGSGSVFSLSSDGGFTTLHQFGGDTDGSIPFGGLVADGVGNLYGTTQAGGVKNAKCLYGYCGTVFKIASDGTESVLYQFQGGADGSDPVGRMVLDKEGNLYGITAHGGAAGSHLGFGTVFKLTSGGAETVLYRFGGHRGEVPAGGLIADKGFKHLYGVTSQGKGASQFGTVFTVRP